MHRRVTDIVFVLFPLTGSWRVWKAEGGKLTQIDTAPKDEGNGMGFQILDLFKEAPWEQLAWGVRGH